MDLESTVGADVGRGFRSGWLGGMKEEEATLRGSAAVGLDHATEFGSANDVAQTDGGCFLGRCREIRRQVIAG